MDDAIERALTLGTAISVVRNSNHYGIAGWYAMRAAEGGLIGVSLTNTSPLVAPTRARVPMLGHESDRGRGAGRPVRHRSASTWPPARSRAAGSRSPRGAARRCCRGWAIEPDGSPATTPDEALAGALQPLGGTEETAGYKGYGLALDRRAADRHPGRRGVRPEHRRPLLDRGEERPRPVRTWSSTRPRSASRARSRRAWSSSSGQLTEAPLIPNAPGPVLCPGEPEAERTPSDRDATGIVIDREHHENLLELADGWTCRCPDPDARVRRTRRPPWPAAASGTSVGRA